MNRCLLTGAAGFIGSRVAELLLDDGNEVVGVDDLNDAYDVRLKQWRLAKLRRRSSFEFRELDISDRAGLCELFNSEHGAGFSAVVNLAARAGVRQSVENPWVYIQTNVVGTLNLLELCRDFDVTKFILASTSSVYGATCVQPFREDANVDNPLSPYAASKRAAEGLCYTYHHLYGLDVTVLRYFTVYGPAGRPDMSLFRFVQRIQEGRPITVYGDGTQRRDFTYVDDIAAGTMAALSHSGFDVINLGSDQPVVLNDAISLVERLVGSKAIVKRETLHAADVSATWANIGKAEHLLGWRPRVDFEEGVQRLVDWYRENREWAEEVRTD
jgi:nucleoside-diphosphate-sugar epimerase